MTYVISQLPTNTLNQFLKRPFTQSCKYKSISLLPLVSQEREKIIQNQTRTFLYLKSLLYTLSWISKKAFYILHSSFRISYLKYKIKDLLLSNVSL